MSIIWLLHSIWLFLHFLLTVRLFHSSTRILSFYGNGTTPIERNVWRSINQWPQLASPTPSWLVKAQVGFPNPQLASPTPSSLFKAPIHFSNPQLAFPIPILLLHSPAHVYSSQLSNLCLQPQLVLPAPHSHFQPFTLIYNPPHI